jgi:hypothetical protein
VSQRSLSDPPKANGGDGKQASEPLKPQRIISDLVVSSPWFNVCLGALGGLLLLLLMWVVEKPKGRDDD